MNIQIGKSNGSPESSCNGDWIGNCWTSSNFFNVSYTSSKVVFDVTVDDDDDAIELADLIFYRNKTNR